VRYIERRPGDITQEAGGRNTGNHGDTQPDREGHDPEGIRTNNERAKDTTAPGGGT